MRFPSRLASYGAFRLAVHTLALTAALGAAAARPLKLVALGDSLIAGYGLGPGQAFPDVLQKALKDKGYDVTVINSGVSGDTAGDGAARFDWSVPHGVDAVIVELGANDMLRGLPPAGAKRALSDILRKAREAHLPTLLVGMKAAPNLGPDYRAAFDAIYPDLAAQYGVTLYPFLLDGVAADPKLNQPDGLHPNPDGVSVIVERMLPAVTGMLDKVK